MCQEAQSERIAGMSQQVQAACICSAETEDAVSKASMLFGNTHFGIVCGGHPGSLRLRLCLHLQSRDRFLFCLC